MGRGEGPKERRRSDGKKRQDKEKKHLEKGASTGDGSVTCVAGNAQEMVNEQKSGWSDDQNRRCPFG